MSDTGKSKIICFCGKDQPQEGIFWMRSVALP
jgi:hypothetical protein